MSKIERLLAASSSLLLLLLLGGCGGSNSFTSVALHPSDFSVSVSAQSVFVPIGVGSSNLQLSVQGTNGFNRPVYVSLNGLPAGVKVSPSSTFSLMPGATQTITFSAEPGMQPTLQQLSFQAQSGILSHTSTVTLSVADPVYAYVAVDNSIVGYVVDANTGALSAMAGGPAASLGGRFPGNLVAVSESGGTFIFLLMHQDFYDTLASFKVDPATGSLTPVQTIELRDASGEPTGGNWLSAHPSGKFLYTQRADYLHQTFCILAYVIDPATGNLTESSCTGGFSDPVVVTPQNFAYALNALNLPQLKLNIYSVKPNDGSLTLLQSSPFNLPGRFFTDPLGHAFYDLFARVDCDDVYIWSIDPNSGSLAPVNSSFSPPKCAAQSLVFTPNDSFAYVNSLTEASTYSGLYAGAVDSVTGNLTDVPGSPFFPAPLMVQVEPSQGKFLVGVVSPTIPIPPPFSLTSFAIDPQTGVATHLPVAAPMPTHVPVSMAIVKASH